MNKSIISKLSIFKNVREVNHIIEKDELVELDDKELDNVMAVGNSLEASKWILNNNISYLINKKMY